MVRAIMLLSLISLPSFAGDNEITIITKGTGNSITTKQIGNGNDTTILCGAGSSGSVPGSTYVAHSCTNANWTTTIDGNSNTTRMYTVWSNNTGSTNNITISGNDNFAYIDQDEDDNTSSITQTGNSNHAEQLGTGDDNEYSITQIGNSKYAKIFAFGDNSDFTIHQSGSGLHNTYIWNNNYADNNTVVVTQSGTGNKDADILLNADADNTNVNLTQSGAGAHTANMVFTTDNYTVDVDQLGSSNQSYSATFNCITSCNKTITITQQ